MEERGIFFQTVILPIRKRSIIGVAIVFWKYYLFIYLLDLLDIYEIYIL